MNNWNTSLKILVSGLLLISAAFSAAGQRAPAQSAMANPQPNDVDQAPRATPGDDSLSGHRRNWRYKINPSDTLELTFSLTPEFNQTVTVQPDGYITLRDVGDLQVAGKTLAEFRDAVKQAYSKILHDPVISVDPKDFEKPYFIVGGQVGKPGKFDLRSDVTVTQAIAIAGGFTDMSKHSQVLLFRRVSDQWTEAKIINVKKMFASRDLQEDPDLRPGDMLYVPKNAISKIKPFLPTSSVGAFASQGVL